MMYKWYAVHPLSWIGLVGWRDVLRQLPEATASYARHVTRSANKRRASLYPTSCFLV